MPVDWTALAGVVMGTLIILIPVAGVTARFALKPIAEAFARVQEARGSQDQLHMLEQRMQLLEQQQANIESTMERLEEVVEFHDRLEGAEELEQKEG
jgi:hypothetical protein